MIYNPIKIGKAKYGGQEFDNGLTFAITSGVLGDVMAAGATAGAAGTALICPAGAEPIGVLATKDADNQGAVYSFEKVALVKYTGTPLYGVVGIQGDGNGGVQFVASGTATSLKVVCIGIGTSNGVNVAAVVRQ